MFKHLNFPILLVHRELGTDSVAGRRLANFAAELEGDGFPIISTSNYADGIVVADTHRGLSCILLGAEGINRDPKMMQAAKSIIASAHGRAPNLPIILLGERGTIEKIKPAGVGELRQIRQIIYLYEDTVTFMVRQIERAASAYLDNLLPPFFKALANHAAESNYSWHTPGHGGGVAFKKSPVGRAFHEFYGENTFRSDLSISVPELGSLLEHTGPIGQAEARAAKNFGADHTLFVINGTSTANKIVWHGMVGRDDLVLVDRNCHKSLLHSLIMTGATPIYFVPSRNDLGIIGPISLDQFSPKAIADKVAKSAIARGKKGRVKLAVVTNSTYDGICYNAELIKHRLADAVDALHFDEAWYAYAAFHEFYAGRHGMGQKRGYPRAKHPLIFATHSTHKLLAAFSMASMLHVQNSEQQKLDLARFNEAFMMHTSTSPQYGIIASIDVASAMMEGPAGRSLVQETHDEAMSFRGAMANVGKGLKKSDWWFKIWQPDGIATDRPPATKDWVLKPGAAWHGFGKIAADYAMLDPIKVTLVTPGMGRNGALNREGIPAAVLSKYLWERGIVVEKTGLYSFLVLFSMGITKGKWSTLVTELLGFKRQYDENVNLEISLPSVAGLGAAAYRGMGLKDLCNTLHQSYRDNDTARAQRDMYMTLPDIALKPCDAYDKLVHGKVQQVEIDKLMGRMLAVMLVPYPPGIPLIMPGERLTKATGSIVDYLKFARDFDAKFPGFETEIHGLCFEHVKGEKRYLVDCIKE